MIREIKKSYLTIFISCFDFDVLNYIIDVVEF